VQSASEAGGQGYVRVSRSEASATAVIVSYQIAATSTAAANDYAPLGGTITIPANQTTADILITAIDDLRREGTEELHITLTAADQLIYVLTGTLTAEVEILDN